MSIKSKMVSLSAAAVLTLTFAGHSFAAANPFTDLTNVTAKEKIIALQEQGYVKGVGDNLFARMIQLQRLKAFNLLLIR
ncbi:hypothetical protein Psch_02615 [Pelotomaculum schinkii]|uniref:SLH domain-containing protein n=1 Tax=Pelotomaculum schinkii TaxID=78350 RepID=A0A4Y7R9F3_9FIRM|nr:hypothetical protein [Pelotomaculum schinkii]TEB05574.1 hypothetical protein Psch_02615 [Pelotomaculum schinkii]